MRWHEQTAESTLDELSVSAEDGLSSEEARHRLQKHGANKLQEAEKKAWWQLLIEQLQSIVVYLLAAAAVVALVTQRWAEGIAVVAVIIINTAIGFLSEWKAATSMAALRALSEDDARVRRDGKEQEVKAQELVPGDVVLLGEGELVPADLRVVEAKGLRANEAALTGESVATPKSSDPIAEDAPLAERKNMLYKGTSVADGQAVGVVVGTGQQTELGRIAELAGTAESSAAPLAERLDQLGHRLAWLTLAVAAVVALCGWLVRKQDVALVIETSIALGVAAIPEGLPVVATIALARGMYQMARRNALINRLTAVETLGATRIIFSDKTGTLTQNRMRVERVVTKSGVWSDHDSDQTPADELTCLAIRIATLCNSASIEDEEHLKGDPTEIALLRAGETMDLTRDALLRETPEVRVEEFDPHTQKMATFHKSGNSFYVAVKGAPRALLDASDEQAEEEGPKSRGSLSDEEREAWAARAKELASEGLRVLAVADKDVTSKEEEPYTGLRLVGLVGLVDPPRKDVKKVIDSCQAAGIRIEMVTGDQAETAKAIARAVGIVGDEDDPEAIVMLGKELDDPDTLSEEQRDRIRRANIFARVSPEQKLNLVRISQERGEVVAMTGDGINDAPALKKADIGIAMGRRGTEAAKQVADMVLQDDRFETIVSAVEQGRVIFANIRKSVMFMLTTNIAEVLAVTVATLAGFPLPLLPLQILYLNVLTDVFPALALGVGPASGNEMSQPPRAPEEAVLMRRHWTEVLGLATVVAASVCAALLLSLHVLKLDESAAVTVSFLTLGFSKLWYTFTLRAPESGWLLNEVTRNVGVWAALLLCVLLLFAAVYVPGLSHLLHTQPLGSSAWGLLGGLSLVPLLAGQVVRAAQHRQRRTHHCCS